MSVMEVIGVLAAILGLIVLVGRVVYPIWTGIKNLVNWLDKFRRDWEGEEAEPGRARVPGVMERLNRLDGELSHNGGSSLKDAVNRIEIKLFEVDEKIGMVHKNELPKRVSNKGPRNVRRVSKSSKS